MTTHRYYLSKRTDRLAQTLDPATPKSPLKRLFALPAYHWVLIASLVALAVHLYFLPVWLGVVGVLSIFLQKNRFRTLTIGKRPLFAFYRPVQYVLFFVGLAGIFLQFSNWLSLDVSVSFLLLCMLCKVWELKERRDAFILLNMNLFVLASAFLWTQHLLMAVAVAIGAMFVLFAFVALGDPDNPTGKGRLRALLGVGIPALPLLVVLFLFFPRISPLWTMPMASGQAKTGVSDTMSPGDISNLSKSSALAFRVEFEKDAPPRHELYWRVMVLDNFDGITWRVSDHRPPIWRHFERPPVWATPIATGKLAQNYTVLLEPNQQHWLAVLEHSRPVRANGIAMTNEYNLRSYSPIVSQTTYQVQHLKTLGDNPTQLQDNASISPDSPHSPQAYAQQLAETLKNATQLPQDGNPKSRELAQRFFKQANGDPKNFVGLIQEHIHKNNFRYTLSPPVLQNDRIDEFLFGTQAGFCEHYASSFVFLAREVGIPARVVVGYQGGERGLDGKSWEVRQMDAHAWAEVWADNAWVRIDPTAFVAPHRIEDGMNSLTDSEGASMFGEGVAGTLGYQQFRLLQNIRYFSDQASYYWQKNIINFDQSSQQNALMQLFNIQSLAQQLTYLVVAFGTIMASIMAFFWYRRRATYHPLDLVFVKLSKTLAKQDLTLARADSEPVLSYLARLKKQQNGELSEVLNRLASEYRKQRFGKSQTPNPKALQKDARVVITKWKK